MLNFLSLFSFFRQLDARQRRDRPHVRTFDTIARHEDFHKSNEDIGTNPGKDVPPLVISVNSGLDERFLSARLTIHEAQRETPTVNLPFSVRNVGSGKQDDQ